MRGCWKLFQCFTLHLLFTWTICFYHWLQILGEISSVKSKPLKSGLLGQTSLFLCPGSESIMICGGTQEKFGLFSEGTLPIEKCDLPSCLLQLDGSAGKDQGFSDNPNYMGCQSDCKRWFHAYCLGLDYGKYVVLSQRSYWQCNRFDCKSYKSRKWINSNRFIVLNNLSYTCN